MQGRARVAAAARKARAMLRLERQHWQRGVRLLAGVDEAGMGALAGPVVAAAVILSPERPVRQARDSKVLPAAAREDLDARIRREALAVSVGLASVAEIAQANVYHAGLLAMRRAVLGLQPQPEVLLVDARTVPGVDMPQEAHVKGDARSCSIASASIVAKVHRDALMRELAEALPGYGLEHNAGYATADHLAALRSLGPTSAHRDSWEALAEHAGEWSAPYYRLREALRDVSSAEQLVEWARAERDALVQLTPGETRKLHLVARRRGLLPGRRGRARREADTLLPFA